MDPKIVIKHLAGSKAGETQEFDLARFKELLIGRDDGCAIRFDAGNEDLVSRTHAKITLDKSGGNRFVLADLGSTNGTFLNNRRILEPSALAPGDEIRLGASGPRFCFDMDLPAGEAARTRVEMGGFSSSPATDATRTPYGPQGRPGMGRQTLEFALDRLKGNLHKTMINGAAVLLAIIVSAVAYFSYRNQETAKSVQQASSHAENVAGEVAEVKQALDKVPAPAVTPADIYRDYRPATVFIESSWKLVSALDGRDVCRLHVSEDPRQPGERTAIFTRLSDGTIEPVLVTSTSIYCAADEKVGSTGMGSGFVADKNGFILTNSHVASPWLIPYALPQKKLNRLCQFGDQGMQLLQEQIRTPAQEKQLAQFIVRSCERFDAQQTRINWIPERSGQLGGKSIKGKLLKGLHNYLYVTFPGNDTRIEANLVNASEVADIAQIKVSFPQPLPAVTLSKDDGSVKAGDPIVVLGYPGLSPDVVASRMSQDPTKPGAVISNIPNPTVTDGTVGKLSSSMPSIRDQAERKFYNEAGDTYQLTVNATGHGNSGGPVFDSRGEVIGIFTYAWGEPGGGGRVSAAVPIKYGRELMNIQPVF